MKCAARGLLEIQDAKIAILAPSHNFVRPYLYIIIFIARQLSVRQSLGLSLSVSSRNKIKTTYSKVTRFPFIADQWSPGVRNPHSHSHKFDEKVLRYGYLSSDCCDFMPESLCKQPVCLDPRTSSRLRVFLRWITAQ